MKTYLTPLGFLLASLSFLTLSMALVFNLSSCALVQKVETDVSAQAKAFQKDPLAYAQTLAKALQTGNGVAVKAEGDLTALASSWGLNPVTPEQQAIFDKVTSQVAKASGNVIAVDAVLSNAHLDAIVHPPTSLLRLSPKRDIRPPHGSYQVASAYDLREVTR